MTPAQLTFAGLSFCVLVLAVVATAVVYALRHSAGQGAMATETGGYDGASAAHEAAAFAPAKQASLPSPYSPPTRRVGPPLTAPPVTPETVPVAPSAAAAQPVRALRLEQTLQVLNDSLHLMLVGESNAGKSTAAEAVLASRAETGDQVVVLDPHADPTTWRGLPAIGTGRDYPAIAVAMEQLLAEMTQRYLRKAAGDTAYPPVTIFIDEWPSIQLHCKAAGEFMAQMAQEARKVAMRLVILTQSDRVESLGLSGKGDVRENFVMLLLGNKATAALPETARMSRPAAVRKGSQLLAATVDGLDQVGRSFQPRAGVVYNVPAPAESRKDSEGRAEGFDLDAELARFMQLPPAADPGLELINGTGGNAPVGVEKLTDPKPAADTVTAVLADTNAVPTSSTPLPDDDLSVAIRALVGAGLSRNKVVDMLRMPGQRAGQLRRIKVALGEIVESANALQEPAAPVGAA